jgi:hypothetical protein
MGQLPIDVHLIKFNTKIYLAVAIKTSTNVAMAK